MRASRLLGRLLGLALLVLPGAALAALDEVLGVLADDVLLGRQGDWEGSEDVESDAYRLDYLGSRANAVRYFHLDNTGMPEGRLAAGTEVVPPTEPAAFAGLLWGYRDQPRRYLIFALTGDGRAVVWRRDDRGLAVLAEISVVIESGDSVVLVAFERDGVTRMVLEDKVVATLKGEDAAGGAPGIVAGGPGSFRFFGFGVMDAAELNISKEILAEELPELDPVEGPGESELPEPEPPEELIPPLPPLEPAPEPTPPPLPAPEPQPVLQPEPPPLPPTQPQPQPQPEPVLTPPPLPQPTQEQAPAPPAEAEAVETAPLGLFGPPATVREAPLGAFAPPAPATDALVPPPLPTAN